MPQMWRSSHSPPLDRSKCLVSATTSRAPPHVRATDAGALEITAQPQVIPCASTNTLPAGFVADVNAVAGFFATQFTDNVTFTLHVGFGEIDGDPVDPTLLGQGETRVASYGFYSYAQIRAALANDARTADDVSAVNSLPATDAISGSHQWPIVPGVRDFYRGGYASPDGGVTNLNYFNTNPSGDVIDWAETVPNDSFGFEAAGAYNDISVSDLRFMDILGYDRVDDYGADTNFAGEIAVN